MREELLSLLAAPLLIIAGFAGLILYDHYFVTHIYRASTVVSVGGCDKDGYCGVLLEDGASLIVRHAVIGQRARYEVRK